MQIVERRRREGGIIVEREEKEAKINFPRESRVFTVFKTRNKLDVTVLSVTEINRQFIIIIGCY